MRFTKDEIRKAMLLYAVTDSSWLKEGQTLAQVVEDVLANGATFLQIREKEMEHGAFLAEARQLQATAAKHHVPFRGQRRHRHRPGAGRRRRPCGPERHRGQGCPGHDRSRQDPGHLRQHGGDRRGRPGRRRGLHRRGCGVPHLHEEGRQVPEPGRRCGPSARLWTFRWSPSAASTPATSPSSPAAVWTAWQWSPPSSPNPIPVKPPGIFWSSPAPWWPPMDKQFCIFDMDGTLVDSMGYWKRLGREFLAQKGVTENVEPVLERIKPMTMTESAALFIESFCPLRHAGIHCGGDECRDGRALPPRRSPQARCRQISSSPSEPGAPGCAWPPPRRSPWPGCVWNGWAWQINSEFLLSCDAVGGGKDRPDVFFRGRPPSGGPHRRTPPPLRTPSTPPAPPNRPVFTPWASMMKNSAGRWMEMTALADETIRDWREAL